MPAFLRIEFNNFLLFTFISDLILNSLRIELAKAKHSASAFTETSPIMSASNCINSLYLSGLSGDASVKADAECVALANSILSEFKIKSEIKVNNRKLLNSILRKAGIEKNQKQVLREIDKMDKLDKKEVEKNLSKIIESKNIKKLYELFEKDLSYFLKEKFEGADEIKELEKLGKVYGFKIKFEPTLMRGFSYYTGNVWEIWGKEKRASLAAGGRFDDKVGKYSGRQIPAVGISFGTFIDLNVDITDKKTEFLIVSLNKDKESILLAEKLRKSGKSVIIYYGKPSRALEYANAYYIDKVIFFGEDEVKSKKLKIKNMKTGKEKLVSEKDIKKI